MRTHHEIICAVGVAIAEDSAILALSQAAWGKGISVIVGAFGDAGFAGVDDAPFVQLLPSGENKAGNTDAKTFACNVCVGGVDETPGGTSTVRVARTATANGLCVYGIQAALDAIRDRIVEIVSAPDFTPGAIFDTADNYENAVSEYPLATSSAELNFTEPQNLAS